MQEDASIGVSRHSGYGADPNFGGVNELWDGADGLRRDPLSQWLKRTPTKKDGRVPGKSTSFSPFLSPLSPLEPFPSFRSSSTFCLKCSPSRFPNNYPSLIRNTMSTPTPEKLTQRAALEEVDRDDDNRPPFLLSLTEVKLLGIAGVRSCPFKANCWSCDTRAGK